MWRVVLGGVFTLASLFFAVWSSYTTLSDVHASPTASVSTVESFRAEPNQPDPNVIYSEINKARKARGLQPLARSDKLAAIAEQRAHDMSAVGYYAHRSPSGTYFYDMFEENHYVAGFSCENLDLEFSKMADIYVNAWLNSTHGHRECLLSPLIAEAGYATAELKTSTPSNQDVASYVVVAIYAEPK